MTTVKTSYNRRSFLKVSAGAMGGIVIGFNWFANPRLAEAAAGASDEAKWYEINAYLSIASDGQVVIMSPNPEIGQNVKTSMPMIIAEELDVPWSMVSVQQSALNTDWYQRQVAGGSQSIRFGWQSLRMAGATAKQMLINAAATAWGVNASSLIAEQGMVINAEGEKRSYGSLASAASKLSVPEEVSLKDPKDFTLIGRDTQNVDLPAIVTGKPLFGIDTRMADMRYAMAVRAPAFGLRLKSFDASKARKIQGIEDIFSITVPLVVDGFANSKTIQRRDGDIDMVAIVANSTWAAMQAQKVLDIEWQVETPLEDSASHDAAMLALLDAKKSSIERSDGNVEARFSEADKVVERTYSAPVLAHNCMEPMNFFAHVTDEQVHVVGPVQTPAWTRSLLAGLLKRNESDIKVDMTRMGGGFGRRLFADFALQAAEISRISKKPIQLQFSREDDMTSGMYRPASKYKIKAAVNKDKVTAYQLLEAGLGSNMYAHVFGNFPAGAIKDYQVGIHAVPTNITTGAWRAPYSNFLANAEQCFFDELAESMSIDPIDLRLQLLEEARKTQKLNGNYEPDKFIGVIKLVAEKSKWGKAGKGVFQGFSVFYSHNTYVAEVADVVIEGNRPKLARVTVAIDCGIVVNPIAASNIAKGSVIDGVGHAMYGALFFDKGQPQAKNFDQYRLIRMSEAPEVDVHFVASHDHPTGLGEPVLPPAGAALANAVFAATGKRLYRQPYNQDIEFA